MTTTYASFTVAPMNNQEHNEAMISEAKREQRRQRRRAALQQSAAIRERILAFRSGVLLPDSTQVIQELREASVLRTSEQDECGCALAISKVNLYDNKLRENHVAGDISFSGSGLG